MSADPPTGPSLEMTIHRDLSPIKVMRPLLDALATSINLGFQRHDDLCVTAEESVAVLHHFGDPEEPISVHYWPLHGPDVVLRMESPAREDVKPEQLDSHHSVAVMRALVRRAVLVLEDQQLIVEIRVGRGSE